MLSDVYVLFSARQDVSHPSPGPPEAVAGGAGGQRPIPGAGVAGPGRHALRDPVETRHTTHPAAGGRGHYFQGKRFIPGSTDELTEPDGFFFDLTSFFAIY